MLIFNRHVIYARFYFTLNNVIFSLQIMICEFSGSLDRVPLKYMFLKSTQATADI